MQKINTYWHHRHGAYCLNVTCAGIQNRFDSVHRALSMSHAQNLFALAAMAKIRNSVGEANWLTMVNLRQAVYLHQIVECILTEQVSLLPEPHSPKLV